MLSIVLVLLSSLIMHLIYFIHVYLSTGYLGNVVSYTWPLKHVMLLISSCLNKGSYLLSYLLFLFVSL